MPRQRHERRVAGSTPSSGAACLSVRRLLLVVASMGANTQGSVIFPFISYDFLGRPQRRIPMSEQDMVQADQHDRDHSSSKGR
jgi:hypothetical protein